MGEAALAIDVRERPILFSGSMVLAIGEDRKTQTRRLIRDEWWRCLDPDDEDDRAQALTMCPYGQPGDRLWVRETWQAWNLVSAERDEWDPITPEVRMGESWAEWVAMRGKPHNIEYRATSESVGPWTPSIHMPRWASRLTLEVTSVRVERLQDISEEDARAEGIPVGLADQALVAPNYLTGEDFQDWTDEDAWSASYVETKAIARASYRTLWDSINAKRAPWESNPWVWVVSFKRLEAAHG